MLLNKHNVQTSYTINLPPVTMILHTIAFLLAQQSDVNHWQVDAAAGDNKERHSQDRCSAYNASKVPSIYTHLSGDNGKQLCVSIRLLYIETNLMKCENSSICNSNPSLQRQTLELLDCQKNMKTASRTLNRRETQRETNKRKKITRMYQQHSSYLQPLHYT